jgi:hypothetical protein
VPDSAWRSSRSSTSVRQRLLAAALVLGVLVVGTGFVGMLSAAAAVKTDAFCAAYEKLQRDPTNINVIRRQVARMLKAKPPRDIVKALRVVQAVASGDISPTNARVAEATSAIASYVSAQCFASDGSQSPGGAEAPTSRCPLTEQQVSSAVGAPLVLDQASCTFFPSDAASPNVGFVRQVAFACDRDYPAELGYTEQLDGLGVKAYVQPDIAVGTRLLVCDKPPFEITVDIVGDSAAALDAARQLASQVL